MKSNCVCHAFNDNHGREKASISADSFKYRNGLPIPIMLTSRSFCLAATKHGCFRCVPNQKAILIEVVGVYCRETMLSHEFLKLVEEVVDRNGVGSQNPLTLNTYCNLFGDAWVPRLESVMPVDSNTLRVRFSLNK